MNENQNSNEQETQDDFLASLNATLNAYFLNPDEDVSAESALAASRMPAKKTIITKVYDTELGWVEEYVTVDATDPRPKANTLEDIEEWTAGNDYY